MGAREKGRLEERAEREGRIARACGTPLGANPYGAPGQRLLRPPLQDVWRKAWMRGWNQTDAELRDDRSTARNRALGQAPFLSDIQAHRLGKRAA